MSFQDRPSYQRPTKSSSSPSVTPGRRNAGNVPLVRGLSPVRSPYYGRGQESETQRSHDNPLFRSHASDNASERRSGRAAPDTGSTKTLKNSKENGGTEEPWKVHVEKGLFGGNPACTTPGKASRVATMQFTTPPKPVVKRRILSENNRDVAKPLSSSTPRREEESRANVGPIGSQEGSRSDIDKRFSETSSDESDEQQAPMVSIEDLQKRIQRFLQTEPSLEAPVSPVQCDESIKRFSGVVCGRSPEPRVEDSLASYHPVFSPYSPRPEFLRARTRSPSPVAMEAEEEESLAQDRSPIPTLEKSITPTSYDPKKNFLSPRPQFLRYRPLKRLELLRRSADALLDFDLDSPAEESPPDSAIVESESGDNDSQEIQSFAPEVLTLPTQHVEEDVGESKSEKCRLKIGESEHLECEAKTAGSTSENSSLTSQISEDSSVDNVLQLDTAGTENDTLETSEGELDAEGVQLLEVEHIRSLPSRIFRTSFCILSILGFVLLVLTASGNPGILPESLHHNELSTFWQTSEHAAPVRKVLQSVEGLWKECPGVLGYPVNQVYMETLRTNLGEVAKAVTSLRSQNAFNDALEFYYISVTYISRFPSHVARTYSNVWKWLLDAADSYISRAPDVDEWDWVPEYDFVVAKDMFDWAEAYETILARIDSWEIKSIFQSYVESKGARSIDDLIDESSLENDIDTVNSNSESGSAILDIQLADCEPHVPSVVSALSNNQFTQAQYEEPASGDTEEQVLLEENLDQDNNDEFFGPSSRALGGNVEDSSVFPSLVATEDVEPPTVTLDQDGGAASAAEDPEVTDSQVEEHEGEAVLNSVNFIESGEDMIIPFDTVECTAAEKVQHASGQLSQEVSSAAAENPTLLANQDALGPQDTGSQESTAKDTMGVDTEPNLSSSSLLPTLRLAMSPAVVAAVASLLLAAIVAMMFLRPARKYSSHRLRTTRHGATTNTKKGSVDANAAQVAKGKLPRKPQRTFKTATSSPPVRGSNYLAGDSPLPISSDYAEHFSSPILFSEKAYSKPVTDRNSFLGSETSFKPATDGFLSPERSSDKDSLLTPEIEILEDSSLGRFTALVPVVHNEGTEKEEVKLTPVRRSSRIRSRLQSPCSSTLSHFSYSPEL